MKKNNLSRYILFISICTFITTFIFVVQKSYDNLMKPINEAKKSVIIKPVDPVLDLKTLDNIEKRPYHEDISTPDPTVSSGANQ